MDRPIFIPDASTAAESLLSSVLSCVASDPASDPASGEDDPQAVIAIINTITNPINSDFFIQASSYSLAT
jgi:hypothetical protein